jgi:hypothetical protein
MQTNKTLPNLSQFTGTETWWRHPINRKVTFTDGVKYVADEAGAYWLIDEIALCQPYEKAVAAEAFQVWKLKVKDSAATLDCEDGNGKVVYSKKIEFTDFPEPGIQLFFTDNVILLPSEY